MVEYRCAVCDAPAHAVAGEVIRSCLHGEAVVIADLSVMLFGDGGVVEDGEG